MNSSGGLQRYLNCYKEWLDKLQEDYVQIPSEDKVPARTYFLIRRSDKKIVGIINMRLALNEPVKG